MSNDASNKKSTSAFNPLQVSASNAGPSLPISSMGPDMYRSMVNGPGNNCHLVVERDETVSGWDITTLPGRTATISCNGQSSTFTPTWGNQDQNQHRFGLVDITSIYSSGHAVHVEYTYLGATYTEDYPA